MYGLAMQLYIIKISDQCLLYTCVVIDALVCIWIVLRVVLFLRLLTQHTEWNAAK